VDMGSTVRLLLVTSGDNGSSDPTATAQSVARQREQEARPAAALLGISEILFHRHPDAAVEDTGTLRRELVADIRRWRPAIVFTHDPVHPYPPYTSHLDHRVVGRVALDAVYPSARDRLCFPDLEANGLTPLAVSEVWLFASDRPTDFVHIKAGFDRKIAARLEHKSQTADAAAGLARALYDGRQGRR
jgi:LmbE family N-acetylglucosaminyl deacetylase